MKLDWPNHRLLCQQWSDFVKPPLRGMKRVILFPGREKPPTFKWLFDIQRDGRRKLDVQFELEDQEPELWPVIQNSVQGRDMRSSPFDCLKVIMQKDAVRLNSPLNVTVQQVTRAGIASCNFRGPVIVARMDDEDGEDEGWDDVTLRDLRFVSDWFSTKDRLFAPESQKVMGVIVTSTDDDRKKYASQENNTGNFIQTEVNGNDCVFSQHCSSISNLLGIPIHGKYLEDVESNPRLVHNQAVLDLFLDVNSHFCGSPPMNPD